SPSANGPTTGGKILTVSAAASLKDAFGEVAAIYKQQTGQEVTFNFGASGTLQKQIEEGAPVDVFASAGSRQMDELAEKQLINKASRKALGRNELVLTVPADSKLKITNFEQLAGADVKKIAVGNPKTVPAGQYSQQIFDFARFDDAFRQKLILAE